MLKLTVLVLTLTFAAISVLGQAPTLRIVQTDGPNLPADLYYGNIKVKPLRLRPGTNQVITIDDADFFVNQQYVDFLSRFPDQTGFDYWTSQITSCPAGDQACINGRRIAVSDAFFFEPEYQTTGGFVYRVYRAAFGGGSSNPAYSQFAPDRRPTGQTGSQFVDALLAVVQQDSGVNLSSQKPALVGLYDGTPNGRAAIVRQIADNSAFIDGEYNKSFVYNEYAAYLRRDPEQGGYDFWLGQVNRFPLHDVNVQHAMVCSFITSIEYQKRFGETVTHTNAECPQ